jgi:hypothetical protein
MNLFCRPWRWRRYVPPKRRLTLNGLHGVISQKVALFTSLYMFRPIMAIIGRRPTLQRIFFICLVWVTLVLKLVKIDLLKLIQFFNSLKSCCESQWWSCSFTVGRLYCVWPCVCVDGASWCSVRRVLANNRVIFNVYIRRDHGTMVSDPQPISKHCLFSCSQSAVGNLTLLGSHCCMVTGKSIPVTGRECPYGCETSRLPHFLDNRLTVGGDFVSLTRRPHFTPRKIPGTNFC